MPSPAFPQDSVLNKGHSGHGSAPALCQLPPCEHRRERWIGDQRQEQPVLSTGIDPAEVGTRVFSRFTNDHTAPGRIVVCARSPKGSGSETSSYLRNHAVPRSFERPSYLTRWR